MNGVEEAEETLTELRAAFEKAGIVLPSTGLDPQSLARGVSVPLVEPVRCSVAIARRLTAASSAGAR